MKKYIITITVLVILISLALVGCNTQRGNQGVLNGRNESMNELIMNRLREELTEEEIEELMAFDMFDYINTLTVIHRGLGRSLDEANDAIRALFAVNVQGAISAKIIESTEKTTNLASPPITLEIVSEDNKVYHFIFESSDDGRYYSVSRILDVASSEWVYNSRWGFDFLPEPIIDLDSLEFDYENSVKVIEDALSIENHVVIRAFVKGFPMRNIRGAIKAEVVGEIRDSDIFVRMQPNDVLLKIESEDNKHYLLTLGTDFKLKRIVVIETGEVAR